MTATARRLTPAQMAKVIESGRTVELADRDVSGTPRVAAVTVERDTRPAVYVAHLSDGRTLRASTPYRVRVTRA